MKLPSVLAGVAGEYFVAAELSRRGHIASISLRNTRGIDILCANSAGSISVTIQCKTMQEKRRGWVLSKKSEQFVADNHFYVFVLLSHVGEQPAYYIVPSQIVADRIARYHQEWLATPGRSGQQHSDSDMRMFIDATAEFRERWELLGL